MNNKVFWKQANGVLISIDDMDINHLRNVLKMIIRNSQKVQNIKPKSSFKLNGDMANEFNDSYNEFNDSCLEDEEDLSCV